MMDDSMMRPDHSVADHILKERGKTALSFGSAKRDNIMLGNCNKIGISGKIPFSFKQYQKVQLDPQRHEESFYNNGGLRNTSFESKGASSQNQSFYAPGKPVLRVSDYFKQYQ